MFVKNYLTNQINQYRPFSQEFIFSAFHNNLSMSTVFVLFWVP